MVQSYGDDMTPSQNLVKFVIENFDGDFRTAIKILSKEASLQYPNPVGRPANPIEHKDRCYIFIWNRLDMYAPISFDKLMKDYKPQIINFNKNNDIKLIPNRDQYYAWVKKYKPSLNDPRYQNSYGYVDYNLWSKHL